QKYKENIKDYNDDLKIYLIIQDHFDGKLSYEEQKKNAIKTLVRHADKKDQTKYKKFLQTEGVFNILSLGVMDHNKHMIFFMVYDKDKPLMDQATHITRAIYYYKRGLSNKINPIRLKDENNLKYLLEMFEGYSKRGFSYYKKLPKDADTTTKALPDWIVKPRKK
ncbi:MAG: hypothetical protein AAF617_17485, partial [Bacteroidota bacterium]